MELNLDTIEKLVALATAKNLSELTVEHENGMVTIKTAAAVVATTPAAPAPTAAPVAVAAPSAPAPEAPVSNYYKVTSPMVGTFYAAASPESPPFASVGDTVSKGQTLCIIEAMKLMNELECEVSGTIKKINIENGKPVEFGQVLMEIEVQG